MVSETDKKMIKLLFDNAMLKGEYPNFGFPETRCDKCMFAGIACETSPEYVGCLGGWKREVE